MAVINFNVQSVQPNIGRPDPVPEGWYNCVISESEVKPTKDNNGYYLELTFTILDGTYKGQKFWDRLNIQNANQKAQEIAWGTLATIAIAVGINDHIQDSEELHNKPLKAKVKVRKATEDYDASNEVRKYDSINANVQQAPPQTVSAPQTASAPAQPTYQVPQDNVQPWSQNTSPQQPQSAPQQPAPQWPQSAPQQPEQQPAPQSAPQQPGAGLPPWAQGS